MRRSGAQREEAGGLVVEDEVDGMLVAKHVDERRHLADCHEADAVREAAIEPGARKRTAVLEKADLAHEAAFGIREREPAVAAPDLDGVTVLCDAMLPCHRTHPFTFFSRSSLWQASIAPAGHLNVSGSPGEALHPASISGFKGPEGGASFEVGGALVGPLGGFAGGLVGPLGGFPKEPGPTTFGGAFEGGGGETTTDGGAADLPSIFTEQHGVTTIESEAEGR